MKLNKKFMKVLIVQPHMSIYGGGAETVVIKLAKNLYQKKINTKILALSLDERFKTDNPELIFIVPEKKYAHKLRSTGIWSALGLFGEIMGIAKLIIRSTKEADIINVHNFPVTWAVFLVKIFGFLRNKKVIWMCNELPDLWNNQNPSFLLKIILKVGIFFDRMIVNSCIDEIVVADHINLRRMKNRYGRNARVISYGIEYNVFSHGNKMPVENKYNLQENFVLIQVGILSPQKNQMESVKSVLNLREEMANLKLILAGTNDNEYGNQVRKFVKDNNLENNVIFSGHVDKNMVGNLYAAAKVALFPVKSQGGWLSPFEALSAGKIIIVSETMGASELIKKEELGMSTDDFAGALKKVYNKYDYWQGRADRGKQWVVQNLTWEKFSDSMLEVFNK